MDRTILESWLNSLVKGEIALEETLRSISLVIKAQIPEVRYFEKSPNYCLWRNCVKQKGKIGVWL
jgi:hypothetical protein